LCGRGLEGGEAAAQIDDVLIRVAVGGGKVDYSLYWALLKLWPAVALHHRR
jgi:hypothetical protein